MIASTIRTALVTAAAVLLVFVVAPGPAFGGDRAAGYFADGAVHFAVPEGLFVTSTRTQAPEGPVDVITIRPSDPASGAIVGVSFISLTVFHTPLPGDGDATETARDTIVDGVRRALRGATFTVADRAISLADQPVDGVQLGIERSGARATATAGAVSFGGVTVVYYDQRDGNDAEHFERMNVVAETFGFGEPPVDHDSRERSAPPEG